MPYWRAWGIKELMSLGHWAGRVTGTEKRVSKGDRNCPVLCINKHTNKTRAGLHIPDSKKSQEVGCWIFICPKIKLLITWKFYWNNLAFRCYSQRLQEPSWRRNPLTFDARPLRFPQISCASYKHEPGPKETSLPSLYELCRSWKRFTNIRTDV